MVILSYTRRLRARFTLFISLAVEIDAVRYGIAAHSRKIVHVVQSFIPLRVFLYIASVVIPHGSSYDDVTTA